MTHTRYDLEVNVSLIGVPRFFYLYGRGSMKVVKRLGNNAAIALDGNEKEVVVFGKGVGFPKVPYELEDLATIERTFYNIDGRYLEMVTNLSEEIMYASADIVEQAGLNLECELNPNLVVTLADHIQFAVEKTKKNLRIETPLAYDVIHLYPDEYELGVLALDIIEDEIHFRLPKEEAVPIALHIINAEVNEGNILDAMAILNVIGQVDNLIEEELKIEIDKESFPYSRFTMHLRYLIQRLKAGQPLEDNNGNIFNALAKEYPEAYRCCLVIKEYFEKEYVWKLTKDEVTYLLVHIIRLSHKSI